MKKAIITFCSYQTPLTYFPVASFTAGLNFNPSGELAATIDRYGKTSVSDVNTDFYLKMDMNTIGQ